MKFLHNYLGLVLVVSFSLLSILPLFHSGFFSVHDDTQVVRVYEMAKALRDGQFPVRWVVDLGYGYGYPIFNFYSPLPYYTGGFLNLIGFDALVATKIMFISGILLSGIFMYFLAKEFWGEIGGIVAGLFYVYAPYHALDIYVRGAVGEFYAYTFIPLMFLGLYKVFKQSDIINSKFKIQNSKLQFKIKNLWKWVIIGAIGYAGIILSHNLTAMMVTPILVIGLFGYWIIWGRRKKLLPITYCLLPILFGLGLSAFYWLPALLEMGYTNVSSQIGGGADFRDHFVCVQQLWDSPWGFGGSAPGCLDGISFKIGKLHLIILAFTSFILFFLPFLRRRFFCFNDLNHDIKKRRWVAGFIFVVFLLSVFFTTERSRLIWEVMPLMAYIQYPWRFLIFTIFAASFLAGAIVWWFKDVRLKLITGCVLLVALLFYNVKYFQPQKYLSVSAQDYLTEENIKWRTSKISDEYLPKGFPKPQSSNEVAWEKVVSAGNLAQIANLKIKSNRYTFNISGKEENLVLVKVALFPGWTVFLDGKEKLFLYQARQIVFAVPSGEHKAEVVFKETPARLFANFLSLLSFVILLGGIKYGRKVAG